MVSSLVSCILFLCCILLPFHICNGQGSSTYNVVDFGAIPGGTTDSTRPFRMAWALACGDKSMSTMYVPQGLYLIKAVEFRGPCKNTTMVRIDGPLVAPNDYQDLGNSSSWILFVKVDRLSILGRVLDAKGDGFWAGRISGQNCTVGARTVTLNWVNDAQVQGLTSIDSQLTHVVINSCNDVSVSDLSITAPVMELCQSSGIKIEQVTYENIQGTSATQVAMIFDCSPTNPCTTIRLQDIKLTYLNTTKAQSSCNNIGGSTVLGVILPENCL
ncbi:polygalacturonase-like [Primulina tabacum]|uniref:polygalacturonase-like n=1 Tax=Primulina tabacum TaxID=48773 RepID=UPI003F596EA4